ncbi:6-pyruvoyl trahydropterin synthase family protein [Candidatus Methylacidithermus pantelleriae]|uniref:6-pyruvoyl trahydropterin synthase family protein n=1 Tax=Candidatus Methylacidithermus pantelleriae TaxID=2744239 RepID=UPI00157D3067|nr:6-carboxytetrahydropterin synthase [Candidatus Methylacidithermus pantelleriae]
MKVILAKDFEFEAAQWLPSFPEGHHCRRIHGHSFRVTVAVSGPVDPVTGILYDHARISEAVEPLIALLDHRVLNEIAGLENPSMERLAAWFWERLFPQLPGLYEIVIQETSKTRCIYRGDT